MSKKPKTAPTENVSKKKNYGMEYDDDISSSQLEEQDAGDDDDNEKMSDPDKEKPKGSSSTGQTSTVTTKPENWEEQSKSKSKSKSKNKSKQEAEQGFEKPSEEVKEHKAFKDLDEKDVQLWFEKTFPTKWANEATRKLFVAFSVNGPELILWTKPDLEGHFGKIIGTNVYNAVKQAQSQQPGARTVLSIARSPMDVVQWHSTSLSGVLKKDFRVSRRLVSLPPRIVSRRKEVSIFLSSLLKRINHWNASLTKDAGKDKNYNPIVTTHGAPGGGKSTYLELVNRLAGTSDINTVLNAIEEKDATALQFSTQELQSIQSWLSNAIAVPVTYNGAGPYVSDLDDEHPEAGLALRVLYSYFYTEDTKWDKYVDACLHEWDCQNMTVSRAVEVILSHQGQPRNVLVSLDELKGSYQGFLNASERAFAQEYHITSEAETRAYTILMGLTKAMDNHGLSVQAVVSTLDQVSMRQASVRSSRKFEWVGLGQLDGLLMFRKHKWASEPWLQVAIADCGGHGRTLEWLQNFLDSQMLAPPSGDIRAGLREFIAKKIPDFELTHDPDLLFALLVPVILGEQRALTDSLTLDPLIGAGKQLGTWGHVIESGLFTNSLDDAVLVVPILPFVWLYKFARILREHPRSKPHHRRAGQILGFMFDLENDRDPQSFERYHAYFENLRQIARGPGFHSLAKSYPDTIFNHDKWDPTSIGIQWQWTSASEFRFLKHHWPGTAGERYFEVPKLAPGDTIIPAANNRGFDVATLQHGTDGRVFVVCFQNKWSDPDVSTATGLKEILEAWDRTKADFTAHFGTPQLKKLGLTDVSQLCLVFACYRNLKKEVEKKADGMDTEAVRKFLPERVLVFDRKSLRELYGPTLASRPQFLRSKLVVLTSVK